MRRSVRVRIFLARRPWLVWLAAGAVTLAVGFAVEAQVRAARAARDAWGARRVVLVATRPVASGTPLAQAGLARRSLPVAALAVDALEEADPDAVVVRPLVTGQVLVSADLGSGDPRFTLVPPGHAVVALPRPAVVPRLEPGDAVLVAWVDRDGTARRVSAQVAAVTEVAVELAVTTADAASLGDIAGGGPVAIALVPPTARVGPS